MTLYKATLFAVCEVCYLLIVAPPILSTCPLHMVIPLVGSRMAV